jgi:hypothetical protein
MHYQLRVDPRGAPDHNVGMQWLSWVLTSGASFIAGVLAELSPKRNWDFLKWPSMALLGLSILVAVTEPATRLNIPPPKLVCVWNKDWMEPGEELRKCTWTHGNITVETNPRWKKIGVSMLQDIPLEVAAIFVGIGLALMVKRRRQSEPPSSS